MEGEIAGLTKDVWLQMSLRAMGKTKSSYQNPLACWDVAELDQLTFEEINIHKDNDMMSLQKIMIWISKD